MSYSSLTLLDERLTEARCPTGRTATEQTGSIEPDNETPVGIAMHSSETKPAARPQPAVGIRYDETAALFTSQVVVNSIEDTVLLECSSGFLRSEDQSTPVLPIQSRLAMSTTTARKLGNLLIEVADEMEQLDELPPYTDDFDDEIVVEEDVIEMAVPTLEGGVDFDGENWLRSAARLHGRLREAIERLPRFDD